MGFYERVLRSDSNCWLRFMLHPSNSTFAILDPSLSTISLHLSVLFRLISSTGLADRTRIARGREIERDFWRRRSTNWRDSNRPKSPIWAALGSRRPMNGPVAHLGGESAHRVARERATWSEARAIWLSRAQLRALRAILRD